MALFLTSLLALLPQIPKGVQSRSLCFCFHVPALMSFNFKGTHTFYNDKFLGSSLQKLFHAYIDIKAYIKIAGAVEPLEANGPQIKNILLHARDSQLLCITFT